MRKYIVNSILFLGVVMITFSCTKLDLVQQDAANSENWYQTSDQFRQSINEGYREILWPEDVSMGGNGGWTDDWLRRDILDDITAGTVTSEYGRSNDSWDLEYKAITRMLTVLEEIENQNGVLFEEEEIGFKAEINFLRASYWSYLISHFGDVPFFERVLSIDESFELPRTDKNEILQKIYSYYDDAALNLPITRNGPKYVTKGAAYAMKARIALYMGDFETSANASKACMDLGIYELYPDFAELFKSSTKNSVETIFHIPRSEANNVLRPDNLRDFLPKIYNGYAAKQPTWRLLAAFECIDGLPIDESPLFDPRNPFKNRDPRCAMTIVPFGSLTEGDGKTSADGSNYYGIEYTPHPQKKQIMNFSDNTLIRNPDTRSLERFASFNGLVWNKGTSEDWLDLRTDPDYLIMRYADVLLMYAESKIELNQIDESVLGAINAVRDRAYAGSGIENPAIATTNQDELRLKVRNERRMELAFEGRRYMDLIRWRLAEKALSTPIVGMVIVNTDGEVTQPATGALIDNVVNPGLWFWGLTPEIDEDGLPDFTALLNAGLAQTVNIRNFPERQYLWPIPAEDRLLNPNLTQNEGY